MRARTLEELRERISLLKANAETKKTKKDTAVSSGNYVSANVGELIEVQLRAAEKTVCDIAGRTACETDWLAISGARFPKDVDNEILEEFNRITLDIDLDPDVSSKIRYECISMFFHDEPLKDGLRRTRQKVNRALKVIDEACSDEDEEEVA